MQWIGWHAFRTSWRPAGQLPARYVNAICDVTICSFRFHTYIYEYPRMGKPPGPLDSHKMDFFLNKYAFKDDYFMVFGICLGLVVALGPRLSHDLAARDRTKK